MRIIVVVAAGLGLAGCSSFSMPDMLKSAPPTVTVQMESLPPGAEARTSTGQTCKTPCAMAIPVENDFTHLYAPQISAGNRACAGHSRSSQPRFQCRGPQPGLCRIAVGSSTQEGRPGCAQGTSKAEAESRTGGGCTTGRTREFSVPAPARPLIRFPGQIDCISGTSCLD